MLDYTSNIYTCNCGKKKITAHDLNTVAKYCDRIIMMKKGKIMACGTPEEVVTEKNIREVYSVASDVIKHDGGIVMIAKHPIPNNDNVDVPATSVYETDMTDDPDAL